MQVPLQVHADNLIAFILGFGMVTWMACRPSTFRAVAPCTMWTMEVKDLMTVVDLYPDLAPVLQEAFHHHLKNQVKRTPGKAW